MSIIKYVRRKAGSLASFMFLLLVAPLILVGVIAAACTDETPSLVPSKPARPYAKEDVPQNKQARFPSYVTSQVRDAYEFALANPDKLQYMPCYCGCGLEAKHTSNLSCYISGADASGAVVFTDHATYCDICLEVARDTKRLVADGKSLKEIRAYIDQKNGQKGPATKTAMPPS